MNSHRILFVHHGKYSNTNKQVLDQLRLSFPNAEIHCLNTQEVIKSNPIFWIRNIIPFIREYGLDFIKGHKSKGQIKNCFITTGFMFEKISHLVKKHFKEGTYDFAFQTQSLFESNVPGKAVFIYTDHTNLTNKQYPQVNHQKYLRSSNFIEKEHRIYQNAALNFVMSKNVAQSMIEDYQVSPEKVVMSYGGPNAKVFHQPFERRHKRILFVGLDWERKGGPVLLKAFAKVLDKHPDAELTIVGCSPETDLPNVNVLGRVPLDQMPEHFQKNSIFCFPSLRDPAAMSVLEAMNYKMAVVTNKVGAFIDYIDHGKDGFLVENNDPDLYAQYLDTLLSDQQLTKAIGEKLFAKAVSTYNWSNTGSIFNQEIRTHLSSVNQKYKDSLKLRAS